MTDARQSALNALTTRFLELGGPGQKSLFLRNLAHELTACYTAGSTRRQMWKELRAHGYTGSYNQFTRTFQVLAGFEIKPPRALPVGMSELPIQPPVMTVTEATPVLSLVSEDEVSAQQKRLAWARQKAEEMAQTAVPVKKKFEFNP
jgi:hypothetical protein